MPAEEEDIRLAHVLTHPVRYKMAQLLSKKSMYIAQLSNELEIDRKVLSFHLKIMEREGLLTTELEQKNPPGGNPVLVRYAKLTEKAQEIMKKCGLF